MANFDMKKMEETTIEIEPVSALEASLASRPVQQRPMSRQNNHVYHHHRKADLNVNEFELVQEVFSPFTAHDTGCPSTLQDHLAQAQAAVQEKNAENYSSVSTNVHLLKISQTSRSFVEVDDTALDRIFELETRRENNEQELLSFFTPLIPWKDTSFGAKTSLSARAARRLIDCFDLPPESMLNMLGRPDYWAPSAHHHTDCDGQVSTVGLSLQHPRWNLQVQGSPLSVIMCHDVRRGRTVYVVVHKQEDTSINLLHSMLERILIRPDWQKACRSLTSDPLDLHTMLLRLSFEASKPHVKRFQRFMWEQFKKVDDYFDVKGGSQRSNLDELTKELQVVSYNADSHIMNAHIVQLNAQSIVTTYDEFRAVRKTQSSDDCITGNVDAANYILASMKKQERWFVNYKSRKATTMGLVFNLVTQQDAANNIRLAIEMRKDSCSMSGIATLTMMFLPATFVATLISSNVFSSSHEQPSKIAVTTSLFILWIVLTSVLTAVTMGLWRWHQRTQLPATETMRQQVQALYSTSPSGNRTVLSALLDGKTDAASPATGRSWRGWIGLRDARAPTADEKV